MSPVGRSRVTRCGRAPPQGRRVRRPYVVRQVRGEVPSAQLSGRTNLRCPNGSTDVAVRPARRYGNATITSISSEMTLI